MNIKEKTETFKLEDKGTITEDKPLHIALDLSWWIASDVVIYDVREVSPFVSYYIVASVNNLTRLESLKSYAEDSLYDNYCDIDHIEGKRDSDWILIDAKDIVLQLFTTESRNKVKFDELYKDVPHQIIVAKEEPKYERREKAASQINNYEEN